MKCNTCKMIAQMKSVLCLVVSLGLASIMLYSCIEGKNKTDNNEITIETIDSLNVPDIVETVGTIGDGTAMNTLELINDKGDTVVIECPSVHITGGARVGERVSVVYTTAGETNTVMACVNMTSIEHLWSQKSENGKEQSIEFNDNGRATTYDMRVDYNGWSIKDGKLLLYSPNKSKSEQGAVADTFDIMELSEDKLVLMNGDLTTEFERAN